MLGEVKSGTISAAGQTQLPLAADARVCVWTIHFESSSFSGSVTIRGAASGTNYTTLALGYKDMETGDVATSAVTGNRLVLVDGSGINVQLDCTSYVSGSLAWTAVPQVG